MKITQLYLHLGLDKVSFFTTKCSMLNHYKFYHHCLWRHFLMLPQVRTFLFSKPYNSLSLGPVYLKFFGIRGAGAGETDTNPTGF
jgi:hypothetical protein